MIKSFIRGTETAANAAITTITITKNSSVNFSFLNFDNGLVVVEPDKTQWDIALTTSSNYFFDFATNTTVPYRFKDITITNTGNVKVQAVTITDEINFDNFSLQNFLSSKASHVYCCHVMQSKLASIVSYRWHYIQTTNGCAGD